MINTYPQNFIVLVHFWPKLMWTSSIKKAHRDMWFQLSVAYICHSGQSWLMNIWLKNFAALVHFWPKLIWARSVKEDENQIKCDLYLLFWPKLINEYLFTKFYCSYLLLAKADVDWIDKKRLMIWENLNAWMAFGFISYIRPQYDWCIIGELCKGKRFE